MQNDKIIELLNRIDKHLIDLNNKVSVLDTKVDAVRDELKEDILRVEKKVERIDEVNARVTRDVYMLKEAK
ncbi:MAG: hypothetical protein CML24_00655 [Rhizobiales bacterium]|mgnify:CR=1 FL=1|jgi:archaellum component FlaC|nr:hypothetical protein [Hyphomicrobiales bacterium]|tara:strand:+ start:503 stop:715 length:213 start_codon:yes stop_codon:yes gene_type:complete